MMRAATIVAAVLFSAASASAMGVQFTANHILPGCKVEVAMSDHSLKPEVEYALAAGVCIGTIETIMMLYATASNAGPTAICIPDNATTQQLIKVAIRYMDARPQRLNESFALLAIEAFRAVWPCSDRVH